jgi:hypothetical protein
MRLTTLLLLIIALSSLAGCERGRQSTISTSKETRASSSERSGLNQAQPPAEAPKSQNVSLDQADSANAASQATQRKIIRNGDLTLEVASPTETQRKIFSIAEARGGFVVTSEMTQQTAEDKSKPALAVNLVVRVPAMQFEPAMEEIRAVASRVVNEKRTGQDVTEEFIDLEARIKNQKALELQFIEIMKRAAKVQDALDVQTQLAAVRTEIERLEGRKRFLENQASLSTVNVTLQTPTEIVNATGFWYSIKSAFADGLDAAIIIILFLIRVVVALLPLLILIVLPVLIIARIVVTRVRRRRKREVVATDSKD